LNRERGAVAELPFVRFKNCFVSLKMFHFSLDWEEEEKGKEIPNVEILDISSCKIGKRLPLLSKVHSLYLSSVDEIQSIPFIPTLRKCTVSQCNQLTDFTTVSHVKQLSVWANTIMTDVSMLGNIPKLFLMNCYGITSLTGLGGSNNRETEIRYRFPVVDFSPLKNLYRLILQNVEQTIPAQEICQVTHLVIRNCPQFLSTNSRKVWNSIIAMA
jgi:hypothetical protein